MSVNTPFIYTFSADGKNFVYDVGTNNVMEVEPFTAEIIKDLGRFSSSEIVRSLQDRFTPAEIRSSLRSVKRMQKKYGLFSSKRPKVVRDLMDREVIRKSVENDIRHVILELTQACNLKCIYCIYGEHYTYTRKPSSLRMSLQTAQKAIVLLANHSGKEYRPAISFYGGEPLLEFPLMVECIRYAKGLPWHERPRFLMTTNGTLLTDEVIDFLVAEDVELEISLDGYRTAHDRYRKWPDGKGTYDLIVDGLRRIRQRDARYYIDRVGFNLAGAPPENLEETAYFLATSDLVGPDFQYSPISRVYTTMFDCLRKEEQERFNRQYESMLEKYIEGVCSGEIGSKDSPIFRLHKSIFQRRVALFQRRKIYTGFTDECDVSGRCIPGQRRLFVTADGSFWPCERLDVHLPSLCIGHVDTGLNMDRILSLGSELVSITAEDCKDCFAIRNCNQCFSILSSGPGGKGKEWKRERCEDTRRLFKETLRIYCSIIAQNPKALDFVKEIEFG